MPPSFSDAEYWDKRFRASAKSFDWLCPESCFDEELAAIAKADGPVQILHIGSGTSMLPFYLSRTLPPSSRIRNLDFSIEAVEWGRRMEAETRAASTAESLVKVPLEWAQASLLSMQSLLTTTARQSIDLIIDKSTSDAIACGPDIAVQPSLTNEPASATGINGSKLVKVHPLYILALNLAVLVKSGARWLCLSYSNDRFPFYPSSASPSHESVLDGVSDPMRYWKIVRKTDVQTEEQIEEKYQKNAVHAVHRALTSHWMYVLERTEVDLDERVVLGLKTLDIA